MSEKQIAALLHNQVEQNGVGYAWGAEGCPIVNAGPNSAMGHSTPTDGILQRGQLLHSDFGVRVDGFCSDMQRMLYFLAPGESQAPAVVQHGFDTVVNGIQAAAAAMQPGVCGAEIDAIARQVVTSAGYPEFMHRAGPPAWTPGPRRRRAAWAALEKYGDLPDRPLETGQVYTIEPSLFVPGYGVVGVEEDVLLTEHGIEYLGEPRNDINLEIKILAAARPPVFLFQDFSGCFIGPGHYRGDPAAALDWAPTNHSPRMGVRCGMRAAFWKGANPPKAW